MGPTIAGMVSPSTSGYCSGAHLFDCPCGKRILLGTFDPDPRADLPGAGGAHLEDALLADVALEGWVPVVACLHVVFRAPIA